MRPDGIADPAVIADSVGSGSVATLSSKMAALREIAVTIAADAAQLQVPVQVPGRHPGWRQVACWSRSIGAMP